MSYENVVHSRNENSVSCKMTGTENIQKNLSEKIWSQTCKKRQKKSQGMMERHRREPLVQGATGSRALSHLPLDLLRNGGTIVRKRERLRDTRRANGAGKTRVLQRASLGDIDGLERWEHTLQWTADRRSLIGFLLCFRPYVREEETLLPAPGVHVPPVRRRSAPSMVTTRPPRTDSEEDLSSMEAGATKNA